MTWFAMPWEFAVTRVCTTRASLQVCTHMRACLHACVSRQKLLAWTPCPFVSRREREHGVQDGKIVLLVHCGSWIAGIRANEVVAGRLCAFSLPLSCQTRSRRARFLLCRFHGFPSSSFSSRLSSRVRHPSYHPFPLPPRFRVPPYGPSSATCCLYVS